MIGRNGLRNFAAAYHTFWPRGGNAGITMNELTYGWSDADGTHHDGLDAVVHLPGVGNLWPMPIDNRLKMLATGIKSDVGVKISGPDHHKNAVRSFCPSFVLSILKTVRPALHRQPPIPPSAALLPGCGYRPRKSWALWANDRRRAGCHQHGNGRDESIHGGRGDWNARPDQRSATKCPRLAR